MAADRGPFLSSPFVARAARWGLLAWSIIGILILASLFFRYVVYPVRIVFPPLLVTTLVASVLAVSWSDAGSGACGARSRST